MNTASKEDLESAWKILAEKNINEIHNVSKTELGRIVTGNPNYSDAERRFAGIILILAAKLAEIGQEDLQ